MDIELNSGEALLEINEDLRLIQKDAGLKFGTDSYLLSAFVKKNLHGDACDLGAGTGVVSLFAAARCSFDSVHAVEIQKEYAVLAERNAALNSLTDKIKVHSADVREISDILPRETFSAVFTNPPYMASGSGKDSKDGEMNAARREENGTLDDFVRAAAYLLKYGGLMWTVIRPERTADLMYSLKSNGLEPKKLITVYPDAKSAPCLILTEAKRGGSPSLVTSRPLIIYEDGPDRKYTKDMSRVYDEFSLSFLFDKKK
ncbi:MAG: methyltransferase [Clostridia bacterium]|nr:methyltransferase [Clostridia bacterium]